MPSASPKSLDDSKGNRHVPAAQPRGIVFDVQHYALYDGPGIRSALYLKGCPLRCLWCHNPESQVRKPQLAYCKATCGQGRATQMIGEEVSANEAATRLLVDREFFEFSGGGVTITGGEPTSQPDFLIAVLKRLRSEGVHTAIETCGFFSPALIEELINWVDLFLFDIKHLDPLAHRRATGVSNERILENFAALLDRVGPERLTARIPVIPGYNGDEESMRAILHFLAQAGYQGEVHLMPYHDWARGKYESLGRRAQLAGLSVPAPEQLAALSALASDYGLQAVVYG